MAILQALLGAVILLMGHRLFWLLVAIVGFLFGTEVAARLFAEQNDLIILLLALVLGLIGAVLAVFAQKIAIAVVGFFLASGVVMRLMDAGTTLTLEGTHPGVFLLAVIAGIIGAVLAVAVFDWALIVLTSIYGALMITGALPLAGSTATWVWIALAVLGIAIQAGILYTRRRPAPAARPVE